MTVFSSLHFSATNLHGTFQGFFFMTKHLLNMHLARRKKNSFHRRNKKQLLTEKFLWKYKFYNNFPKFDLVNKRVQKRFNNETLICHKKLMKKRKQFFPRFFSSICNFFLFSLRKSCSCFSSSKNLQTS